MLGMRGTVAPVSERLRCIPGQVQAVQAAQLVAASKPAQRHCDRRIFIVRFGTAGRQVLRRR
jgi:hypothetical protein